MKIHVVGKLHLKGTSKKTGHPYDFIQIHYLGKAPGVEGNAALTPNLDPQDHPFEGIKVPGDYIADFDGRGFNTHSNADHIGGNKYLQGQTGCKIYAPGIDCAFNRHPILEPSFLYGGYPCKELRHKFLMAQESVAQELTKESLPEGFAIIPLPGHFFDMVGFRTSDDVVYLADFLSSRETLDKYQIGFIYDVAAYLKTMEMVKSLQTNMFVPVHAAASEDIADLAQYNIDKVLEIADMLTGICREPLCFEAILQRLFTDYAVVATGDGGRAGVDVVGVAGSQRIKTPISSSSRWRAGAGTPFTS